MKGIIAINNLGYIGKDNKLMWRCSNDLKHFKRLTNGGRCLVGYNTNLELPPLKNRTIIVDTKDLIESDRQQIDWCIGGKKTYEKYARFFTHLHISHINNNDIGDTMMPDFSQLSEHCTIYNYYFEPNK